MWEHLKTVVGEALGSGVESGQLNSLQVALRGVLVFFLGIAVVRLAHKRFLGKATPFDTVLAVMLGTVIGRAINGSAPLVPTIVGALVLVLLHRLVAAAAFHSKWVDALVKGHRSTLVEHGEVKPEGLSESHFGLDDLEETVRLKADGVSLDEVERVYLERNGSVSVARKKHAPRVLEVRVEPGVQIVRIQLE